MLLAFIPASHAGLEDLSLSAKGRGLADATSVMTEDPSQIFGNPAAIFSSHLQCALTYARPFGLKALDYGHITLALPYKSLTLGSAAKTFGNDLYREMVFSFAWSYHLHKDLFIGSCFRYGTVAIQNYGKDGALLLDIGAIAHLNEDLACGFSIHNINHAALGKGDEPLPTGLQTGIKIKLMATTLFFDLYKEIKYPLDLRCALQIHMLSPLTLRAGVGSQPSRLTAGFGLSFKSMSLDYGFSTHSVLDVSHQFSLRFYLSQF